MLQRAATRPRQVQQRIRTMAHARRRQSCSRTRCAGSTPERSSTSASRPACSPRSYLACESSPILTRCRPPGGLPAASCRHTGQAARHERGTRAAIATARAAGALPVAVSGYDPRADPAAITALFAASPRRCPGDRRRVRASPLPGPPGGWPSPRPGCSYRAAARCSSRCTGCSPSTATRARLRSVRSAQQGLSRCIASIRRIAAAYQPLSRVPVVPTFEIIATVAQASPGPTAAIPTNRLCASLRPWVSAPPPRGMYVVLDLQPGRASLLAQARRYRSLLRLPNVGLALDPEWKLRPGQLPLRQIGRSASRKSTPSSDGWRGSPPGTACRRNSWSCISSGSR